MLLDIVSAAQEFEEFPVRHNEDKENAALSQQLPLKVNSYTFDSPHTKVNLLLQAHFTRATLPSVDYLTDTKSVLDQCLRIMQSVLDISAENGWLNTSLSVLNLMQMCCQGRWIHDSDLLSLPHIETEHLTRFYNNKAYRIDCLPRLIEYAHRNKYERVLEDLVGDLMDKNQIRMIYQVLRMLPQVEIGLKVTGAMPSGESLFKGGKGKSAGDKSAVRFVRVDTNNPDKVYDLYEDEDYVLSLDMRRVNCNRSDNNGFKAYCPKFAKPKDENWVAILGLYSEGEESELLGLKRITGLKMSQRSTLSFKTPKIEKQNQQQFAVSLFFMSDVYLGLDQQFEMQFKLKRRPAEQLK